MRGDRESKEVIIWYRCWMERAGLQVVDPLRWDGEVKVRLDRCPKKDRDLVDLATTRAKDAN